jgi:hypothetical protein
MFVNREISAALKVRENSTSTFQRIVNVIGNVMYIIIPNDVRLGQAPSIVRMLNHQVLAAFVRKPPVLNIAERRHVNNTKRYGQPSRQGPATPYMYVPKS